MAATTLHDFLSMEEEAPQPAEDETAAPPPAREESPVADLLESARAADSLEARIEAIERFHRYSSALLDRMTQSIEDFDAELHGIREYLTTLDEETQAALGDQVMDIFKEVFTKTQQSKKQTEARRAHVTNRIKGEVLPITKQRKLISNALEVLDAKGGLPAAVMTVRSRIEEKMDELAARELEVWESILTE